MEKITVALPKSRPSLDTIAEDCFLKLSKFLGIEELMNLGETCVYLKKVVDGVLKSYCQFKLDRKMVLKGEKNIDRVLFYTGRHVTSLALECVCKFNKSYPCSRVMNRINCKSLRSLQIYDLSKECQSDMLLYRFVNVETLSLKSSLNFLKKNFLIDILQNFPKLKSFNIFYARIEQDELKSVLRNNPGIESLVVRKIDCIFDCRILQLIPKVEVLVLDTFDWYLNNVNSLQTLHRIKKLHLNCEKNNFNNLMSELAQKGTIEEMELIHLKVDDKFFEILKKFDKLQLLSIDFADDEGDEYEPKDWKVTTFSCLSQLKYLRLQSFEFNLRTFISTIQQLKCLEKFDLSQCSIAKRDKSKFKELAKLSQEILSIIVDTGRQQRLDLVMPSQGIKWGKGRSEDEKLLMGTEKLRIFCGGCFRENLLGIEIKFDGHDPNEQ